MTAETEELLAEFQKEATSSPPDMVGLTQKFIQDSQVLQKRYFEESDRLFSEFVDELKAVHTDEAGDWDGKKEEKINQ